MHGFVFNIRRIPVSNSSVLFVRWVIDGGLISDLSRTH